VVGIPVGSIKWLKIAEILPGEHAGRMEDSLKVWAFALPGFDPSGFCLWCREDTEAQIGWERHRRRNDVMR
jgi:hypothetical protein